MRIIALVGGHALAHVTRALEVAQVLRERGHDLLFAGQGKYMDVAARADFETIALPFVPLEQIVAAIRSQRLFDLYRKEQLAKYVSAELALYEEWKPDLLLIDHRITACTSGQLQGIPRAVIVNVHMTNYREIPFYSLRNALPWIPGPVARAADRLENASEILMYDRVVVRGMNKLRRDFGLNKRYSYDVEMGDLVLLADLPEFNPTVKLPDNVRFIGPLTWHNTLPPSAALKKLDPSKKCVYFTIGSSGLEELIEASQIFDQSDVEFVIATGAERTKTDYSLPNNVFIEEFVNTDALFPRCDLVVCHGGNGTLYQALAYGIPIVGIATHAEQNYGLNRINQLGLGIGYRSQKLRGSQGIELLMESIGEVLHNPRFRANAQRYQKLQAHWNGPQLAADAVEELASAGRGARLSNPLILKSFRRPQI